MPRGISLKGMSEEELSSTLEKISTGEPALSPALALKILDEFARMGREERARRPVRRTVPPPTVSGGPASRRGRRDEPRDRVALSTSPENTVSFHMKNILAKLHLKNRAQAAAFAIRAGLADDAEAGAAPT